MRVRGFPLSHHEFWLRTRSMDGVRSADLFRWRVKRVAIETGNNRYQDYRPSHSFIFISVRTLLHRNLRSLMVLDRDALRLSIGANMSWPMLAIYKGAVLTLETTSHLSRSQRLPSRHGTTSDGNAGDNQWSSVVKANCS